MTIGVRMRWEEDVRKRRGALFAHYALWIRAERCRIVACVEYLTLTLSWYHLKTTNKTAKCETLKHFCLFFALECETTFIKTHTIENGCVIGPENTPYAGASEHLSARKFYRLGQYVRARVRACVRACVRVCEELYTAWI